MSRRYGPPPPASEAYEERDYQRSRRYREYEDVPPRRSTGPDFLRDDYGRTTAGALVVRERDSSPNPYPPRSRPSVPQPLPPPTSAMQEVVVKERGRPDRVVVVPRGATDEEIDATLKREDERVSVRLRGSRDGDREEIVYKHEEIDRPGWKDDVHRDELIYRREERGRPPDTRQRERERERDELVIRQRDRSLPAPPPGRLIARDREEFVVRKSRPPPPKEIEREEIIIRRRERSVSSSSSSPSPPPAPIPEPVVVRPPIHQEVITHHRHIDYRKSHLSLGQVGSC